MDGCLRFSSKRRSHMGLSIESEQTGRGLKGGFRFLYFKIKELKGFPEFFGECMNVMAMQTLINDEKMKTN
ncbi:hypothetical protein V6N13_002057 [Hibiscus sabdariffa]